MNFKSVCMPLKPKLGNSGYKILPLITQVIGEMLECESIFTFNILHSFKDSESIFNQYIQELESYDIFADKIVLDKDLINQAKKNILYLYKKGLVTVDNQEVVACNCGVINTTKENLLRTSKMKLAHFENGDIICNKCNTKCSITKHNVLILQTKSIDLGEIKIFPENLSKEINDLLNTYKSSSLLISKTRDTGIKLDIDGDNYFIDIDMIWSQYLTVYNNERIISTGSSHVLFPMVLSYIMEKAINGTNDLIFLAVPYLKNPNPNEDLFSVIKNNTVRKLLTMFSCKWNSKECFFSKEIFSKLNSYSQNEVNDSYQILTKYSDGIRNSKLSNEDEYHYFSRLIKYGSNFQKNLK